MKRRAFLGGAAAILVGSVAHAQEATPFASPVASPTSDGPDFASYLRFPQVREAAFLRASQQIKTVPGIRSLDCWVLRVDDAQYARATVQHYAQSYIKFYEDAYGHAFDFFEPAAVERVADDSWGYLAVGTATDGDPINWSLFGASQDEWVLILMNFNATAPALPDLRAIADRVVDDWPGDPRSAIELLPDLNNLVEGMTVEIMGDYTDELVGD